MQTPLHDAATDGDTAKVEAHLRDGADVNAQGGYGYTPLMWAAAGGHLTTVPST